MANTPRYNFVTPSPWLPALQGATTAMAGIMQEQAASDRQKQRIKGIANLLGAEGYTADAQVYEQLALAETPDYGTAALTGKAITRDLSMPVDHVLKVLEKSRDRKNALDVANMRSGSSLNWREFTANNNYLKQERSAYQKQADEYADLVRKLDVDIAEEKDPDRRKELVITQQRARKSQEEAQAAATAAAEQQRILLEEMKRVNAGVRSGTGKETTSNAIPFTGEEPGLPPEGVAGDGSTATDTLLPQPSGTGTVLRAKEGTDSVTESSGVSDITSPGYAPAALAGTAPPVRKLAPSNISVPSGSASDSIPEKPLINYPSFNAVPVDFSVGREQQTNLLQVPSSPTTPAVVPDVPKISTTQGNEARKQAATTPSIERPNQPAPKRQPTSEELEAEKDSRVVRGREQLTADAENAAKNYQFMKEEFMNVKNRAQLELVEKRARAFKGEFAYNTPEEAVIAGDYARRQQSDAQDYTVTTRRDPNTGKHNYTILKKSAGVEEKPNEMFHIRRGPYAGQVFTFNENGNVVRFDKDGNQVIFHLKSNPKKLISRGEWRNMIENFNNSELADTGEIPENLAPTQKEIEAGRGNSQSYTPAPSPAKKETAVDRWLKGKQAPTQ